MKTSEEIIEQLEQRATDLAGEIKIIRMLTLSELNPYPDSIRLLNAIGGFFALSMMYEWATGTVHPLEKEVRNEN